ncbi:MAG: glycine--tRNA ligase subunit beta, partial [Candidatus Eutrophobiaceae bacterium]
LETGEHLCYATPRRLAVFIRQVFDCQADQEKLRLGPYLSKALNDDGSPNKAGEGFARSCGIAFTELQTEQDPKGERFVWRTRSQGRSAAALLPDILRQCLGSLPITKRMRWGTGEHEFVRPVRWVTLLLGKEALECQIMGQATSRYTHGHRFHHPEPIALHEASEYATKLRHIGMVIPDFEQRRVHIIKQAEKLADDLGTTVLLDPNLLNEITASNEYPHVLAGHFDKAFLALPEKVLIACMQARQKYFPLKTGETLFSGFLFVSNIQSKDPDAIILGNERVLRARLADARFFYERDRARWPEEMLLTLKTVTWRERCGTLQDKTQRLVALCATLAAKLGIDEAHCRRAAELSKGDLLSEMVGEFPSLQGAMGAYYALQDGTPHEVANAIEEQYLPRFAKDTLPQTPIGKALAIAERVDTLAAHFLIGQVPDGEKDPYSLRRTGIGLLRILLDGDDLHIDLQELIQQAIRAFPEELRGQQEHEQSVQDTLFTFLMERLNTLCIERGHPTDAIAAVLAVRPTSCADFSLRLAAMAHFRSLPKFQQLVAANKRIRNILRQANVPAFDKPYATDSQGDHPISKAYVEKVLKKKNYQEVLRERQELAEILAAADRDFHTGNLALDESSFAEAAEQQLAQCMAACQTAVERELRTFNYRTVLTELAELHDAIDRFFTETMVMTEQPRLYVNRIKLLAQLRKLFLAVADISELQISGSDT